MEPDYMFSFNLNNDMKFYIASACNNPWTIEDESSPQYFSDSHRMIRSLLYEKHRVQSGTCYYIYHSEDNGMTSIYDKDRCVEILQRYNTVFYNRIPAGEKEAEPTDIELFDRLLAKHRENLQKPDDDTDFSLNSSHTFECNGQDYIFSYDDRKVQVKISPSGEI